MGGRVTELGVFAKAEDKKRTRRSWSRKQHEQQECR